MSEAIMKDMLLNSARPFIKARNIYSEKKRSSQSRWAKKRCVVFVYVRNVQEMSRNIMSSKLKQGTRTPPFIKVDKTHKSEAQSPTQKDTSEVQKHTHIFAEEEMTNTPAMTGTLRTSPSCSKKPTA
jgi:hypothetical protein